MISHFIQSVSCSWVKSKQLTERFWVFNKANRGQNTLLLKCKKPKYLQQSVANHISIELAPKFFLGSFELIGTVIAK